MSDEARVAALDARRESCGQRSMHVLAIWGLEE